LLSPVDNFARCIQAVKKDQVQNNPQLQILYEGVMMTEKELLKAFKANGLDRLEPVGEKFDYNTMNALSFEENGTKEANTVAYVIKPGYILNKRVIRPVDVVVVKSPVPKEQEKQQEHTTQT